MQVEFESTPSKKLIPYEICTPLKESQNYTHYLSTPRRNFNPQLIRTDHLDKENTPICNVKQQKMKIKRNLNQSVQGTSQFTMSRFDQDYQILKTLGKGCFSSVHLCRSKMTGNLVAIKEAKASSMSINEVQALGTLSIFAEKSKNIVRYYHSWQQHQTFYIVMQYCQSNLTTLYDCARNLKEFIPEEQIKRVLQQALQGLGYMHKNKMVHLDIKPDNLLFKKRTLKIADLGLCRITRIKKWSQLEEGDSRYLAKEILNYHEGIDLTKSDIFSLGIAIYEGITLINLPNNGQQWHALRQSGLNFSHASRLYSKDLIQIILMMTRPYWEDRPSAIQLLKMPYFYSKSIPSRKSIILNPRPRQRVCRKQQNSV